MKEQNMIVAPSILSADFANMGRDIGYIYQANADWVHIDVMDGNFVPPITFGTQMLCSLRPHSKLPMDVHLMVEHPEGYIEEFAEAGSDSITFHLEATTHAHRLVQRIKKLGKKAGIAIVPSTPASALTELLDELDLILVMSVNPGYGGQKLIPQTLKKIQQLDTWRSQNDYSYLLSIDGGVNLETSAAVRASGVDIAVAGSAFFGLQSPEERSQFVQKLKSEDSS